MKKIIVLVLAFAMVFTLCACGSKKSAGMPNPIHECSREELMEATGIVLDAPEGATDASYLYIDTDPRISQVTFKLDGKEYCYRAQPTNALSISSSANGTDASGADLLKSLNDCTNVGAVLSGMHNEWKSAALVDLASSREGVVAFNDGKDGFIAWLDVVPGVLYSLSMDKGASQDLLMDTADACFVPLQGEVG